MRRLIHVCLIAVLAVAAVPPPAGAAKPQPTSARHDAIALIRSGPEDLLINDGKGWYPNEFRGSTGGVFVTDFFDPSKQDLFALYVSTKRPFSIRFGEPRETHLCTGISHVFFEGPGWWEATAEEGSEATGSIGIWCEKPDGTELAVRYPDYHRSPTTDGSDCVLVRREPHVVSGERRYVFTTPEPVVSDPDPDPDPDPLPTLPPLPPPIGEPEPTPEPTPDPTPTCPAKVFEVVDTRSGRTSTLLWEGDAALHITALVR